MRIEVLSCLQDNYSYLVVCEDSGQAAVIDPGEAYPVLERIDRLGVRLQSVLCTHHHADHVGEIDLVLAQHPDARVLCHRFDLGRIEGASLGLEHGQEVVVGALTGTVLHTPGHTRGSVCYLVQDVLFTGDTLFAGGCGRLFEGSAEQLYHSLLTIAGLPDATRLFYGHEYGRANLAFAQSIEPGNPALLERISAQATGAKVPIALALEKATNPFLRCREAEVRARVVPAQVDPSPLEVFTQLRQQRDVYH